jgi:hypothetical protein
MEIEKNNGLVVSCCFPHMVHHFSYVPYHPLPHSLMSPNISWHPLTSFVISSPLPLVPSHFLVQVHNINGLKCKIKKLNIQCKKLDLKMEEMTMHKAKASKLTT